MNLLAGLGVRFTRKQSRHRSEGLAWSCWHVLVRGKFSVQAYLEPSSLLQPSRFDLFGSLFPHEISRDHYWQNLQVVRIYGRDSR